MKRYAVLLLIQLNLIAGEETPLTQAQKQVEATEYWSYPYPQIIEALQKEGKDSITIFSYGSLMDVASASRTLSSACLATRRPAIGYKIRRIFDRDVPLKPGSKWCQPAHDKARGMLNVLPTSSTDDFVNGVLIDVPLEDIPSVLFREEGYDLMPIIVQEWDVEQETVKGPYHIVYTFYAPQKGPYTSPEILPRPKYYELTRDAALQYGPLFYELWLTTTYLADGKTSIMEWEEMLLEEEPHTQASCE